MLSSRSRPANATVTHQSTSTLRRFNTKYIAASISLLGDNVSSGQAMEKLAVGASNIKLNALPLYLRRRLLVLGVPDEGGASHLVRRPRPRLETRSTQIGQINQGTMLD